MFERQTCHEIPSMPSFCQRSFRDEGIAAINTRAPGYLGHSHKCTPQCLSGGGSSTTTGETCQVSLKEEDVVELICGWDSVARNNNKRQWKSCGRLKAGEERGYEIFKKKALNSVKKLLPV